MPNGNNQALMRIQMANVYRFILENGALDGTESDNDQILNIVEQEIVAFATSRLEVLMGMKGEEEGPIIMESSPLPFNDDEISALKELASTILNRQPLQQQAMQAPFTSSTGQQVPQSQFVQQQPVQQQQVVQQQVVQQQPVQQQQFVSKRRARRKSQLVETDTSVGLVEQPTAATPMAGVKKNPNKPLYAQNASPNVKSLAMPTQAEIDAKNAREVNRTASNFGVDGGAATQLLGNILQQTPQMGQAEET